MTPRSALLVTVVALAAVAAGFLLGRGRSSPSEHAAAPEVVSEAFALRSPPGWHASSVAVPGLALKNQVAMSPPKPSSGALIVGVAPAVVGDSLLPASLLPRVGLVVPTDVARLGNLDALHYAHMRPPGGARPLELYASPITGGALTAVCLGGSARVRRSCAAAIGTLRVTRGRHYPLGADLGVAAALDRAMRELDDARERGAAAMRRSSAGGQAAAARSVARTFATTAKQVRDSSANPASAQTRDELTAALGGAAQAWRRLADAAQAGSADRYDVERFRVRFSERWVDVLSASTVRPSLPSGIAPTSTPSAQPPPVARPHGTPCGDTHPVTAPIPFGMRGLLRICETRDGSSQRVENISHLVIRAIFSGRSRLIVDAPKGLSELARHDAAPATCTLVTCDLPPGASVQLDGLLRPPSFVPVYDKSLSVVIAGAVAGKIEDRVTPYPKRNVKRIVACAEGAKETYESQNPEELILNTLSNGPGCKKLAKDAFGIEDPVKRQSLARDVFKEMRGVGGDALNESLVVAFKTGIRAVH